MRIYGTGVWVPKEVIKGLTSYEVALIGRCEQLLGVLETKLQSFAWQQVLLRSEPSPEKHLEKCSTSLAVQIKSTLRVHIIPGRKTKIRKTHGGSCDAGTYVEPSHPAHAGDFGTRRHSLCY